MFKTIVTIFIMFAVVGVASSQTEDVTLVFKRPHIPEMREMDTTKITVNGILVCAIDSDSSNTQTCSTKVNEGEIKIKISSWRGGDYDYAIDVSKNKTYTFAVYLRSIQSLNLIITAISEALATNKISELDDSNRSTYKVQLISIK